MTFLKKLYLYINKNKAILTYFSLRTNYNRIRLVFYHYMKVIIVLYNALMFNLYNLLSNRSFYFGHYCLNLVII